jgi:hypothetical protein
MFRMHLQILFWLAPRSPPILVDASSPNVAVVHEHVTMANGNSATVGRLEVKNAEKYATRNLIGSTDTLFAASGDNTSLRCCICTERVTKVTVTRKAFSIFAQVVRAG